MLLTHTKRTFPPTKAPTDSGLGGYGILPYPRSPLNYLPTEVSGREEPPTDCMDVHRLGEPTKLFSHRNHRTHRNDWRKIFSHGFHGCTQIRRVWHPCHTHAATKLSSHRSFWQRRASHGIHRIHRIFWRRIFSHRIHRIHRIFWRKILSDSRFCGFCEFCGRICTVCLVGAAGTAAPPGWVAWVWQDAIPS